MRAGSKASREAVLRQFGPVADAAGSDGALIAAQLFNAVDTLDRSGSLRRALTDPARPGTDKSVLTTQLFKDCDQRVLDVLASCARQRWSTEADLAATIDLAGMHAYLAASQAAGELSTVEEELFSVSRTLHSQRELRVALDDRTAPASSRVRLLRQVFETKVGHTTMALLERAVEAPRGRRLSPAIEAYIQAAAARRQKVVAHVTAATELSAAQRTRLVTILSGAYGREIQLNVAIEPEVMGGMRVQVGPDVVDGTILTRVDEARRRLVSQG